MADDEVIDEEIEDPVEYHVSSSAGRIAEELFRHDFAERRVEKIDYFRDQLCEFIHIGCKGTTKIAYMQVFTHFFAGQNVILLL